MMEPIETDGATSIKINPSEMKEGMHYEFEYQGERYMVVKRSVIDIFKVK